jgi:hypothetical protein
MISGNQVILQVAKDTYSGDVPTPAASGFRQVRFSSLGMDYVPVKKQEGVLTGNIGKSRHDTLGIKATGNIATLARPDDLGFFLYMLLGSQSFTSTDVFNFTPNKDTLPSFTMKVDKMAGVYTYPGCMLNSMSFSVQPEDYLQLDMDVTAYDETFAGGALTAMTPSAQRAFRFHQGKVYQGGSTEIADITSIKWTYTNNLESSIQTTGTGIHYKKPQPMTRELTVDLECLYSAASETFRQSYFKGDAIFSLKLVFQTDEGEEGDLHVLTLEVPNVQTTACSVPVSDDKAIKQSLTAMAIDVGGSTSLVTFLLDNGLSALY